MRNPIGFLLVLVLLGPPLRAADDATAGSADRRRGSVGAEGTANSEALGLKIYANEIDVAPFSRVTYGYDRDAVCTRGLCDDASTVCLNDAICAGIGDERCHHTPCKSDFNLCDDDVTICANNSDCAGIGSGACNDNPCAPPGELCGVQVESLTAGAPPDQTIWELVCDPATPPVGTDCQVGVALPPDTVSWDFSGFNPSAWSDLSRTASSLALIDATETPNWEACGFNPGGAFPQRMLGREDKDFSDPENVVSTLNSIERMRGVCDDGTGCNDDSPDCDGIGSGACQPNATLWLRGIVRYDGIDGASLGEGESRLCHVTEGGDTRTEVPLWRFPNQDASGSYMQLGDSRWEHAAFGCEPVVLYPAAVKVKNSSGFEGKLTGEVVNEGLVKLPSGHQFQSLVVRSIAEYGVFIDIIFPCALNVDGVRTVIYLWEVPHVGTVVRLQSDKIAPDVFTITHLSDLDVKYGIFPPLELNVDRVTCAAVTLSWDPGRILDDVTGYRVYWDTESGGQCLNGGEDCTADHPGAGNCLAGETCCGTPLDTCSSYGSQLTIDDPGTTSATIDGLDPSTTYYFTVTTLSDFTDPASGVTTEYESVLYPTQIPAVPQDLPIEVSATTAAAGQPTVEVLGVRADKEDGDLKLCWDASEAPPCIEGYRILGATSPQSADQFSSAVDVGLGTCHTFDPPETYFIVVGRGSGGTGPWGHFAP